jgi:hypothetical protein
MQPPGLKPISLVDALGGPEGPLFHVTSSDISAGQKTALTISESQVSYESCSFSAMTKRVLLL